MRRLDCDGLEEGQDVVGIVCNGGQRLGCGQLRLTCLRRILVLCLNAAFAVFVIVVVFPAGVSPFLRPLCDGASENIQELARVQLPVEDCSLHKEWREKDGVAQRPVPLLIRAREFGGGEKENFRDQKTDIVAVHRKATSILKETTEYELISPARTKSTTDPPRDLFPTVAWPNVNRNLPGVALLVSIARLRKSSQTFLYFSAVISLAHMIS